MKAIDTVAFVLSMTALSLTLFRHQPRQLAKWLADRRGYFWMACPRCGRHFGGHEWMSADERYGVKCSLSPGVSHGTCCRKPTDKPDDDEVCRRVHERREK